jgi:hypothetical protein
MQQEFQAQMQQQQGPPPEAQQGQPPQQGQEQQQQAAPSPEQQQAMSQQQQQAAPPPEQQQAMAQQQQQQQQAMAQQQQQQAPVQGVEQSPMNQQVSGAGGSMVDLFAQAKKMGSHIKAMNEVDRYRAMAQLRASNPDLYMLVNNYLSGTGMKPMRPLPEVLPPRAAPDTAQI